MVRSHSGVGGKTPGQTNCAGRCALNKHVCRHVTHLLRGIDDAGVVAELQGADHRSSNTHQQRKGHLLQDKRVDRERGQRRDQFDQLFNNCILRTWENSSITVVSSFSWGIIWPETLTHLRFQTTNEVIGSLGDNTWTLCDFFYFTSVCFHNRYNDKIALGPCKRQEEMQKHN